MEDNKPKRPRNSGMFVKGDPRCGRPPGPTNKLSRLKFAEIANKFLFLKADEFQAAMNDPDLTMIERIVGGTLAQAARDNDTQKVNYILDRLVPRVRQIEPQQEMDDADLVAKKKETAAEIFVVEMNKDGKFLRARPRQLLPEEIEAEASVIDITPKKDEPIQ